jgi:hypothetical protein
VLILQWVESGDPYWDDALGGYAQGLTRILTSTLRRARDEAEGYYQSLHAAVASRCSTATSTASSKSTTSTDMKSATGSSSRSPIGCDQPSDRATR